MTNVSLLIVVLLMSGYGVIAKTARKQHGPNAVRINKCCEANEILLDMRCSIVNSSIGKFLRSTLHVKGLWVNFYNRLSIAIYTNTQTQCH